MPSISAAAPIPRPIHDLHPEPADMRSEVLRGLRSEPKTLPCKYFYDARGSQLFDQICELDEYYVTRTEVGILEDSASEIASELGPDPLIVELGSGSSTKTHVLLDALEGSAGYVPIDISREHLREAAHRIAASFPDIHVWPVCADFNDALSLPPTVPAEADPVVFFPGSTIGNFNRSGQKALLERLLALADVRGARLLIGIDLIKDRGVLEDAYNDAQGVTAEFNLNLLRHINTALDANFEVDHFTHRAHYDGDEARIEMQLVSRIDQLVRIGDESVRVRAGEAICTEHSHKFSVEGFEALAAEAGWRLDRTWQDPDRLFAILLLSSD
jgi:dimethylhistidine N-methyltransferase